MKPAITLILTVIALTCAAQNYTRDAGIRIGTLPGLSYRQYLDEGKSFEAQAVIGGHGIRLRVFKLFSKPALMQLSDNITFTYGYGGHAGLSYYRSFRFLTRDYYLRSRRFGPAIGLDAFLSLEYTIREFPLIVEINAVPFFEFSTNRIFYVFLDDTAISIKYKF